MDKNRAGRHPKSRQLLARLFRSTGQDDVVPFAFLSGFLAAALLTGLVPVFLGTTGSLGSILFWLSGNMLVAATIGAAFFLYRLYHQIFAGEPEIILTALDLAPEASVITDLSGEAVYANGAYRLMMAVPDGDIPSPLDLSRLNADPGSAFRDAADLARGGAYAEVDVICETPDRQRRNIRLSARLAGRKHQYIIWQLADVTWLYVTRRHVEEGWRMLSAAFDELGTGFMVADRNGLIVEANDSLCSWLNAQNGTLESGTKLSDIMKTGSFYDDTTEYVCHRADNTEVTLQLYSAAFECAPAAGISHTIIVVRNPEEEEKRESKIISADIHLEKFFSDAPVGIATADAVGNIYECNRMFQKMWPDYEARSDHNLRDILPADDLRDVLRQLTAALKGDGKTTAVDARFKIDNEATAQIYIHSVTAGGETPRAILYLVDTTEQKNLEMQFAQSQKMQAVGQLAGGIAHDFNNLLTAITGFCDLLLVRHGPGDQSFEDIMQIKQNGNRAANLVRQLLAFSRQQTLRPKVLLITDILAELSNLLRRLIGENIELRMTHGRDLGRVKVDQGQLEQVIINLAVNARDAMPEGGTVSIRTANVSVEESRKLGHEIMPPDKYVLIEVSDTGIGIPSENIGKIFEPFFSTKEVGKGTGLGLSTVYGIVKQTGGFIFPVSQPGKGAIFRIYLPIHKAVELPEPARAPRPSEKGRDLTGKGSILFVEDEDAVRMFACRALRNKGYMVHEASSGEEALRIVDADEKIDLLISDVVMPQMDGPSLVKEIRQRRDNIKIIFISGYAEDAFRKNLGKDEVFSFLPKPFSLKQLAEKVKEVIDDGEGGD